MEQSPGSSSRKVELWLVGVIGLLLGLVVGVSASNFFAEPVAASRNQPQPPTSELASTTPASISNQVGIPSKEANPTSTGSSDLPRLAPANSAAVAKAVNEALQAGAPYDLARMLLLIESLPKEQFPVVLDMLRKRKTTLNGGDLGGQGPPFWFAFWLRFGELDPETAFAKSLECTDLQFQNRNKLQKHLFQGMGRNDPAKAAALLLSQSEFPNRIDAIEGLMVSWGKRDVKSATGWANQHLEESTLQRAFYALGWAIAEPTNISPAVTMLKEQGEGAARNALFSSLRDQASRNPALPVSQVLGLLATAREVGVHDGGFASQMINRCASSDPFATADYLIQPNSNGAIDDIVGLENVLRDWASLDQKAAESWAKAYEGKPGYASVARAFAFAAERRGDRDAARQWIGKMEQ
jgi:hypothetical protein